MADKAPKFEELLEKLETLVEELEGGELDLDAALSRFEEGIKLSKQLNAALEGANRKVEQLLLGADGNETREPFGGEEAAPAKKPKAKKDKASQDTLFG